MKAPKSRLHELNLHIRGALIHGATQDEMKEVFLQTAMYCGMSAAIDSFRAAKDVIKDFCV